MARKVIIDCDPGIDDAVALTLALFDPELEVAAVTAVAGNTSAAQASRNVQAIIEQLDAPRLPRIGAAGESENVPTIDTRRFHGKDGLGNAAFELSRLHHQHPSEKIIFDEVRSAPDSVTIIALGPLTNVAKAFQRDPELPSIVDRVMMAGGSVSGVGNVTPAAEFNMRYDPISASEVFRAPATKTLIPLDVTRRVRFDLDFIDGLPSDATRAGKLLRTILPYTFRAYRQFLGQESIYLHDTVALAAAVHPEFFETAEMAGDVECNGDLTAGSTIFDRRPNRQWRLNMEVVVEIDEEAVVDWITKGLRRAGQLS